MEYSRGIVILYEDLCKEWIDWAKDAKLTTLGVHKLSRPGDGSLAQLLEDLEKPGGRKWIDALEKAGIRVEYELHAMEWLLPRTLFAGNPQWFREDEHGARNADCNYCPSEAGAAEVISEYTYRLAKQLRQNSHNYFLWPDDQHKATCHCARCRERGFSSADTGMIFANAVAEGLQAYDSAAKAAYLAYADAKVLPTVAPRDNVFLEFAPMDREHHKPLNAPDEARGQAYIRLLKGLLEVFPAETTHVLEYWMDNWMFSHFRRPAVKLPFDEPVMDADMALYASFGLRNAKSFGSLLNSEYVAMHGVPPIRRYGQLLEKYIPG